MEDDLRVQTAANIFKVLGRGSNRNISKHMLTPVSKIRESLQISSEINKIYLLIHVYLSNILVPLLISLMVKTKYHNTVLARQCIKINLDYYFRNTKLLFCCLEIAPNL